MVYISRRLAITKDDGEELELSDSDFFALSAPLVILGEPGSGKSELIRHFSFSDYMNASDVTALASPIQPNKNKKVIIDALDELTAYERIGIAISKVLSKISDDIGGNLILTCRAADWQQVANTSLISKRWGKEPVVGRLLPLNNDEIIEFVAAYGNGIDGANFLQEAARRDVVELLRNPQTLLMLISIVGKGWPDTKHDLYERACHGLIQEDNPMHISINSLLPATETLLSVAGFICAQLLLAGKSNVLIDGKNNPFNSPKIIRL